MKPAVPRRPRRIGAIAVTALALSAGIAGGAIRTSLDAGAPCTTASGLPGIVVVWSDASGVVTTTCRYTPPSEALPALVLNEVDYDQVGADAGGFVELYNAGLSPAELDGLALVFVDGADGDEYLRKPLRGSLAPGAYLVVPVNAQNGSPDGVALYDTVLQGVVDALSYEGPIERAFIGPFAHPLVEGTTLPASVSDSNSVTGSLARIPNGSDTGDSSTDWVFTRTVTPGTANVG
jgi:Lamin Tail Domain